MNAQLIVRATCEWEALQQTPRLDAKSREAADCFELLLSSALSEGSRTPDLSADERDNRSDAVGTEDQARKVEDINLLTAALNQSTSVAVRSAGVFYESSCSDTDGCHEVTQELVADCTLSFPSSPQLSQVAPGDTEGESHDVASVPTLSGSCATVENPRSLPEASQSRSVSEEFEFGLERNDAVRSLPNPLAELVASHRGTLVRSPVSESKASPGVSEASIPIGIEKASAAESKDDRLPLSRLTRESHTVSEAMPLLRGDVSCEIESTLSGQTVFQAKPLLQEAERYKTSNNTDSGVLTAVFDDLYAVDAVVETMGTRSVVKDTPTVTDSNAVSSDSSPTLNSVTRTHRSVVVEELDSIGASSITQSQIGSAGPEDELAGLVSGGRRVEVSDDVLNQSDLSVGSEKQSNSLLDERVYVPISTRIEGARPIHYHPSQTLNPASVNVSQAEAVLLQNMLDQIRTALLNKEVERYEIVIKLHPPELGHLTVRVIQDAQGLVSHIQATREEVHSLLKAHLPLLTDTLLDAGLRVNSLTVSHSSPSSTVYHELDQQWGSSQQGAFYNNQRGKHPSAGIYVASESPWFDQPDPINWLPEPFYNVGYSWFA